MSSARSVGASTVDGSMGMLSVVIPALNEEGAIGDTLTRCLEARDSIIASGVVTDVEFLVVSDGSTDRTEEIAWSFSEVTVLTFEENRGYGAAIKCGFEYAKGDLVAFLDADGTCDPSFFSVLIRELRARTADLALGSRMGPGSKMPLIRTIGNRLFASLLGMFSMQPVADTASGMRVIRRDALRHLYPLPDGLHFTPAMSARSLLEGRLKLVETPMPYAERTGQSKLRVLHDGVRFLASIVHAAITFRPARPLLMLAAGCGSLAALTALYPLTYYMRHFQLEEWVIYRVLLSSLFATLTVNLVCAAAIAERIAGVAHGRPASERASRLLPRLFTPRLRGAAQLALACAALGIVAPGIAQYLETTHVVMHWSRAVLGSLLLLTAATFSITGFLLRMMDYIEVSRKTQPNSRPPDRVRENLSRVVHTESTRC